MGKTLDEILNKIESERKFRIQQNILEERKIIESQEMKRQEWIKRERNRLFESSDNSNFSNSSVGSGGKIRSVESTIRILVISGGTIYDGNYYPIFDESDGHIHYYLDGNIEGYSVILRGVWNLDVWTADLPGNEEWPWMASFSGIDGIILSEGVG
jgi:hypothetical protein